MYNVVNCIFYDVYDFKTVEKSFLTFIENVRISLYK